MPNTNLTQISYKKILYASDLSEVGRQAFPYAASIARAYNAELTVFHVVEKREFEKYLIGYINDDIWDDIKTRNLQEARELLISRKRDNAVIRDNVEQLHQDVVDEPDEIPQLIYDVEVATGDAVEEIIQYAQSGGYDMVVIAKHGQGADRGSLIGNTARRVIRYCRVPVLAVDVSV